MLTAEERRFLTDHLRPVGRTTARLAAIQLALVGGGYLAGWAIGTAIGTTSRLLSSRGATGDRIHHRTRPWPR